MQKANGQSLAFSYTYDRQIGTSADPMGNMTAFAFDQRRLLQSFTDENGALTGYEYDALGRLTHRTFADDTEERFTYDANGNVLMASNANVTLTRTYDALNRLTSETDSRIGQPTRYKYDAAGRRQTMVDPNGGITTYAYDKNGQATQVTNPNGQMIQFTYDADGRRATLGHPNGVMASYKYDSRGNLTALIYTDPSGNPLSQSLYTYDAAGNRTSMTDLTGTHNTYQYDALRRLTAAAHPAASAESYSYDAVGNRSSDPSYVFDNADRLVSYGGTSLTYDSNGNLVGRSDANGQTNYAYDARNRLIGIMLADGTSATYKYDALGRRIEKNIGGAITRYVYDGGTILLEQDGSGATVARYTHSLRVDEPLIMDRGGQSYYFLADGAGSVVALADGSRAIAQSYSYDSFGRMQAAPGAIVNPFTYTGREFDPESGLYFYRARFYDADTGRFLQKDPLSIANLLFQRGSGTAGAKATLDADLRSPDLGHAYAYAGNNPVNRADPSGLAPSTGNWFSNWCDYIAGQLWFKRLVTVVTNFFWGFGTNESPIPLPFTSSEELKNEYDAGYQAVKNTVLSRAAVYDPGGTNQAVQNLVSQIENLDSQNLPTGVKTVQLQQILQQNQALLHTLKSW
jgi:RHS repeat-associated protein